MKKIINKIKQFFRQRKINSDPIKKLMLLLDQPCTEHPDLACLKLADLDLAGAYLEEADLRCELFGANLVKIDFDKEGGKNAKNNTNNIIG